MWSWSIVYVSRLPFLTFYHSDAVNKANKLLNQWNRLDMMPMRVNTKCGWKREHLCYFTVYLGRTSVQNSFNHWITYIVTKILCFISLSCSAKTKTRKNEPNKKLWRTKIFTWKQWIGIFRANWDVERSKFLQFGSNVQKEREKKCEYQHKQKSLFWTRCARRESINIAEIKQKNSKSDLILMSELIRKLSITFIFKIRWHF